MCKAVDALLAQAELSGPPLDLPLLGSFRSVRNIHSLVMMEAGRLVPEGAGYLIHVNRRHPEGKRRFTVAHEICHTFFKEALSSIQASVDAATGLFDIRQEEEYLCDVGAGHMLLNPRWLVPMAQSRSASLDCLLEIGDECGTSIEATAFQLAQSGVWPCTFVFWEPGLRKAQRVPPGQAALPSLEAISHPTERLRVARAYGPDDLPFVPDNKSVERDTMIYQALAARGRTEGEEVLHFGSRPVKAYCESSYAPYHGTDGELVHRVISCVIWRVPRKMATPARQMLGL